MSAYPLCTNDDCKNIRATDPPPDFRGCCDSCISAQQVIDGRNRREWARADSRSGYLGCGAAILAVVLIFSFAGPVMGFLTVIASGVLCIALAKQWQS